MIENPTNLYIARHGKTSWNALGKVQGQTDIPLNEEGEKQAEELGGRLKDIHIDKIIASDLIRAKRTAEIATLERKMAVETSEALREGGMGVFEGKQIQDLYPLFNEWNALNAEERTKHPRHEDFSTIETADSIVSRFITLLREASVAYRGKNLLFVTHAAVMSNFLKHVGYTDKPYLHVHNVALIHAASDGVDFEIVSTEGIDL